jgi:hypothetical protein
MENDDYFSQLIDHFILLTSQHLTHEYGGSTGHQLSERFIKRFQDLLQTNVSYMSTPRTRQYAINPLFVIALADTLAAQQLNRSELKDHIMTIYRVMMHEFNQQRHTAIQSSANPWQTLIETTKQGNQRLYENQYFNLKTIIDEVDAFGFDINRCYYYEIFQANGRAELGPILCEFDYITDESTKTWARFQRTETIANGDPCCTFRFYKRQ